MSYILNILSLISPIHVVILELVVLVVAMIFIGAKWRKLDKETKNPPKNGGDITINRNDPTKDYWEWQFASLPEDWHEGDRVIFTIHEHMVKEK